MNSSTSTKPRSSTTTPVPSSDQVVRERPATDRDHHRLHRDVLVVAADAPSCPGRRRSACGRSRSPRSAPSMPRFLKERSTTSATSLSHPGRILGSASRMVTWHAQIGQHRGELAADGPAADHDGRGRQPLEVEHLVGGEHDRAVDLEAGNAPGHRARRQDDVAADQLGAVARPAPGGPARGCPVPTNVVIFRFFIRPLQAPPELVDDLLLAGLGLGELDRGLIGRRSRTPWRRPRCGTPSPSRGTPWPGCSRGAGRCRRPSPSPPRRC